MIYDTIFALYDGHGAGAYLGEPVSVTAHGLQAAHFARQAGAPDSLVVAALLHDIGHLLAHAPDDIAEWTQDAGHERIGAAWLARHFGPEVCEPVRLHVPAKRYLCATDADYFAALSPASVTTLRLQGGPMPATEIAAFEAAPFFRAAVSLRRWDDQAKIAGFATADFAAYRPLIDQLASAGTAARAARPLK